MINCMIMCGGSGSRLFPLSRKDHPKQFLKLTHQKYSLFQSTCIRIKNIEFDTLYIVSNIKFKNIIEEQLQELEIENYVMILEPFGKNTCAAISIVSQLSDDVPLLVLSSDHVWEDNKFIECVENGIKLLNNNVVVFGIEPRYPETGYGYLHYSNNDLIKFIEKPNLETAKYYIESKEYLWNSGNFLFNAKYMESELKSHANDIYEQTKNVIDYSKFSDKIIYLGSEEFKLVRDDSIDFSIMEKQTNGKVVKYKGYWNDIGSFKSIYDHNEKDDNNNYFDNDNINIGSKNCMVLSNRKTATIDLDNIIIVDDGEFIVVMNKDSSQKIKNVVNILKTKSNHNLL